MNRTATPRPYPQGCGRILWIPRQHHLYRGPAGSAAATSDTPSALIAVGLTAPPRKPPLPNKYTSWGKLCGLRREIRADLGIDCRPYVVVLSCQASFAALYPGTGETVSGRDLRLRQLSPASTQPTTTYLYIFVLQDRQALGTGALGDNQTPGLRAVARGRRPQRPGRDLRTVRNRERNGWQREMITRVCGRPERFTAGIVVALVRCLGSWPGKQANSSRPSQYGRLNRPRQAIAQRTMNQPGDTNPTFHAGRPPEQVRLRHRAEVPLIPPRMTSRLRHPIEECSRDLSDRRGRQDWCGRCGRPDERLERQTQHTPSLR